MRALAVVLAVEGGTARPVSCSRCGVTCAVQSAVYGLTGHGVVHLGDLVTCCECDPHSRWLCAMCRDVLPGEAAGQIVTHVREAYGG